MQARYWKFLVQIKAWIFYVDIYADSSYRYDKLINIIIAITSSSSIAAWAVWSEYNYVWAFLIAVSQVITAIKPHFPFNKRLELLGKLSNELQLLFNKADYNWYKVSNGILSEEEINELLFELKRQYVELEGKYLKSESLPEKEQFLVLADQKTEKYFADTY